MKITEFTMEDAKQCANLIALLTQTNKLIDALKIAGIQVTGQTAASKEATLAWVKELATHMADRIVTEQKASKEKAMPAPKATKAPIKAGKKRGK